MNLTLRETATALGVPEARVLEWIKTKRLPTCGRDSEVLVNAVALREWALATGTPLDPAALPQRGAGEGGAPRLSLADAVALGGVFADVPGEGRMDVLREIVARIPLPEGEDRAFITQMVLAREAVASTGIGKGIAIPHARTPVVVRLDRPLVAVAYPTKPIPFDAPDGLPVHTLFMLLSPSPTSHLETLAHLAHALRNPAIVERLKARAPLADLLAALRQSEARA